MEELELTQEIELTQDAEPTETTEKPKKEKARSIDELNNITPKAMTDAEKLRYISHLKSEISDLIKTCENLKHNCDAAYEKLQTIDRMFDNYKSTAEQKLLYVQRAIQNLNDSIKLIGMKGE